MRRPAGLLLACVLLLGAACAPDAAPAEAEAAATSDAVPTPTPTPTFDVSVPDDVCTLLGPRELRPLLGRGVEVVPDTDTDPDAFRYDCLAFAAEAEYADVAYSVEGDADRRDFTGWAAESRTAFDTITVREEPAIGTSARLFVGECRDCDYRLASVGVLVGETLWTADLFGQDADVLTDRARRLADLALRRLTS